MHVVTMSHKSGTSGTKADPIIIITAARIDNHANRDEHAAAKENYDKRVVPAEIKSPKQPKKMAMLIASDDSDDSVGTETSSGPEDSDDRIIKEPIKKPIKEPQRDIRDHPVNAELERAANLIGDRDSQGIFWGLIARFGWKNRSERIMSAGAITDLQGLNRAVFSRIYKGIYEVTRELLQADGMFERNNILPSGVSKIVSHIIGLGENEHATLTTDMEFCQYIITADECQSLDAFLPEDIRCG